MRSGSIASTLSSMPARVLLAVFLAASPAVATHAVAAEFDLDSREYKLMLDPARFPAQQPGKAVDELWEQLKTIIADALDKKDGAARHKGSFDETKERVTVFRDTESCVMSKAGYTLRDRTKLKNGQPDEREITLKFRSPDMMVAWDAYPDDEDAKFEEDIAPLLARKVDAAGTETGAFAHPPSMRSIFSVSIERELEAADKLDTLADVTSHYDDLVSRLERAGAKDVNLGATLEKGKTFHEVVYQGASVDLGDNVFKVKFDLSLWYDAETFGNLPPELAELSFKYDMDDDEKIGPVARRAFKLFTALQTGLGGWASPDRETKTAAALPKRCQ